MKTIAMLLFFAQLFCAQLFAPVAYSGDAGNGKDNGGNGQAQGKIVLYDFDEDAKPIALSDLIALAPGFADDLHAIARAWPALAADIYDSLSTDRFYATQGSLKDLPATTTGLYVDSANIQIAIKDGKSVVISMPAFRQTEDAAYLLFHEALHDLVPGDGPVHTAQVRAAVRDLKSLLSSGQQLKYWLLSPIVQNYAIQVDDPSLGTLSASQRAVKSALGAVLNEQGSLEARCVMSGLAEDNPFDHSGPSSNEKMMGLIDFFQTIYGVADGYCPWYTPLAKPVAELFPGLGSELDSFVCNSIGFDGVFSYMGCPDSTAKPGGFPATLKELPLHYDSAVQELQSYYNDPAMNGLAGVMETPGALSGTISEQPHTMAEETAHADSNDDTMLFIGAIHAFQAEKCFQRIMAASGPMAENWMYIQGECADELAKGKITP